MIGAEVVGLVKLLAAQRGAGYIASIFGLGVASVCSRNYLLKRGYDKVSFVLDRIYYVIGGCIFLDIFMQVLKLTAYVFNLY